MHDDTDNSATGPVPSGEKTDPAAGRRVVLLLVLGGGVGLALGILLTAGVFLSYTFFTHTLPSTRDSVRAFNELNELRQQLNQFNEDKKLQEQEKEEAVRQALSAFASKVRAPEIGAPGVVPPVMKPNGGADVPPVAKSHDPFADIDAEIERLQQTQKVLNTILDVFSRKGKEPAKDR